MQMGDEIVSKFLNAFKWRGVGKSLAEDDISH